MRTVPVVAAEAVALATNNRVKPLSAGSFRTDGGATMGVLPRALWQRQYDTDARHRIELELRLLLIHSEGRNILVDTGLGNRLDDKAHKIYSPSPWSLLDNLKSLGLGRDDIDTVVLTHLHHDHAGGIVSDFGDGDELTFPNAEHIIQRREWKIARNPDTVNRTAYNYDHHLKLLEERGNIRLLNGDCDLTSEVRLVLFAGHSEGFQAVRVQLDDLLLWYPADLLANAAHMHTAVASAYDVCRRDTVAAKLSILTELQKNGGWLIFNHDPREIGVRYAL
ncbi:MAG: MBL fold metallo-hydrolase [Candidatus Cloacimonetes bacterium]|nr:MBL fold metallo-hydrolase [Candidatus Cloacimonadota bacterium]